MAHSHDGPVLKTALVLSLALAACGHVMANGIDAGCAGEWDKSSASQSCILTDAVPSKNGGCTVKAICDQVSGIESRGEADCTLGSVKKLNNDNGFLVDCDKPAPPARIEPVQ